MIALREPEGNFVYLLLRSKETAVQKVFVPNRGKLAQLRSTSVTLLEILIVSLVLIYPRSYLSHSLLQMTAMILYVLVLTLIILWKLNLFLAHMLVEIGPAACLETQERGS